MCNCLLFHALARYPFNFSSKESLALKKRSKLSQKLEDLKDGKKDEI
jgi:hypothetical protein